MRICKCDLCKIYTQSYFVGLIEAYFVGLVKAYFVRLIEAYFMQLSETYMLWDWDRGVINYINL